MEYVEHKVPRRPGMTDRQLRDAVRLKNIGIPVSEIARRLGYSKGYVSKAIKKAETNV